MSASEVATALQKPLPPRPRLDVMSTTTTTTPTTSSWSTTSTPRDGPETVVLPTSLQPIDWTNWQNESNIWEANGRIGYGPLTPEQRASASASFRAAAYRMIALRRKDAPQQIADALAKQHIPQTTMLMGPGGAGKSNEILVLADELQKEDAVTL